MVSVPWKKIKPIFSCPCLDHRLVTVLTTLQWRVILSLENLPCKKLSGSLSVHGVSLTLPEDNFLGWWNPWGSLAKLRSGCALAGRGCSAGSLWTESPGGLRLLRFSCPGDHSTACKCCWEAEMQWDWSTWQLEAGRSQLGTHKTSPSPTSSVC